jgi:hypothetical protein
MLGEPGSEAPFSGQSACFSCSLNRRITRPTLRRSIPRAFLDKSAFHISKRGIVTTSVSTPHYILYPLLNLCACSCVPARMCSQVFSTPPLPPHKSEPLFLKLAHVIELGASDFNGVVSLGINLRE